MSKMIKFKKIYILILPLFIVLFFLLNYYSPKEEFKLVNTILELEKIQTALEKYKFHCRKYPNTNEGLSLMLISSNKCKEYFRDTNLKLTDEWGNNFQYFSDGDSFRIISSGSSWIEVKNNQKIEVINRSK